MDCKKYANLIDDLIEAELDEEIAEQVNLHIFACRNCENEFEMLKSEKQMYSYFLFEVEPPSDLLDGFQAKLEAEETKNFALVTRKADFTDFLSNIFTLKPILAGAILLIAFGFSYFWLKKSAYISGQIIVSQSQVTKTLPDATPKNKEFEEKQTKAVSDESAKIKTLQPKKIEQVSFVKTETIVKKPIQAKTRENDLQSPKLIADEQAKVKQIREFEIETAKQLEKVEMLLRSFRNARFIENGEEYDVAYETAQARRLLEKNIELRRQSEIYGTPLISEMLSKVEVYLVEISNLDVSPSVEEVLDIKQRVKNQNIIAGLQGF